MQDTLLGAATSIATFAFAAGSPGPATLAVAGTAMATGRRQGMALAFGLSVGLAFWGLLAAVGLGLLIAQFAPALLILKLLGASYLFWLAWKSGITVWKGAVGQGETVIDVGPSALFMRGLWLNLLNPKAVLAWVAALALGTLGAMTVTLCAVLGLILYVFYALVFSLAPVREFYQRAFRWIEALFATLFTLAGLRLIFWRAGE